MTLSSINPATEETIAEYVEHGAAERAFAVETAWSAYQKNAALSVDERAELLRRLADVLDSSTDELAWIMTAEMGKPLAESRAEIAKSSLTCRYVADEMAVQLSDLALPGPKRRWVGFEPIGPVLAVMPWNYPIWQVIRAAIPAIAAGNSILLKHAANVSGCALMLESLMVKAGWPEGTIRVLLTGPEAVEELLADARVRGVTLTGGDRAGSAVAALAGKYLKRSVMELGGSDAFVVLADADIEAAAAAAATSRFQNCGQSCIAAKRLLVDASIADQFEEALVARVASFRVGDPFDAATTMGPMARGDLRDGLADLVAASLRDGARVAIGGRSLDEVGYFFDPTVVVDVAPGSPVLTNETFGPVAVVQRVANAEEAIAAANDSPYGLSSAVFGRDEERALAVARRIEAGMSFINDLTASDPKVPFGGVKRSGWGREIGPLGIKEFVNARSYVVNDATA